MVELNSDTGTIFFQISEGSTLIVNQTIKDASGSLGGRLGVYVHSQEDVTWSKMTTVCL